MAPVYLVEHTGPNRSERRRGKTKTGAQFTIPKRFRKPATNLPYVKPREGDPA